MSDNSNGGGLLGGIIMGAGLVMIIMAPFYMACRYRVHVLTGIVAGLFTIYAIFSPDLVAMANSVADCGHACLAAPAAQLILALDKIGWWYIAGILWCVFIWSLFVNAIRTPVSVAGE